MSTCKSPLALSLYNFYRMCIYIYTCIFYINRNRRPHECRHVMFDFDREDGRHEGSFGIKTGGFDFVMTAKVLGRTTTQSRLLRLS